MVRQLRSNQKRVEIKKIGSINLTNFTNENKSVNNMRPYSQSNLARNVNKLEKLQVFEPNVIDHSDAELLDTENDNTKVSYLREPLCKKSKQVTFRKRHFINQSKFANKNIPVKFAERNGTIFINPKKKFKNFETIPLLSSESSLSGISSEYSESDSCDQFDHQNSTQEIEDAPLNKYFKPLKRSKWLRLKSIDKTDYNFKETGKINATTTIRSSDNEHKKKTKKLKVAKISKNSSKRSKVLPVKKTLPDTPSTDLIEQPNLIATALETNFSIQDCLTTNLVPDQSKNVYVIDDLINKPPSLMTKTAVINDSECTTVMASTDDLNKVQEVVVGHQDTYNWPSTSHVDATNFVSSNSFTANVIQDFTGQNRVPTDNINSQPMFFNVIGAVEDRSQNYVPLDTLYTYVASSSIVHVSQKIDQVQESLKKVIETLNYVVQAQEKLQNTQNETKIELQNMKSQILAYENRENWLIENGIILPMKSKEEFIKFCTLLDQTPESRKILEISVHFAINSKRSLTKNISSVIRKYFVCELANQFTAIRYVEGKNVLANTSFYKHLLKNFLEKSTNGLIFPGLTEMDFNKALGEVLCNAKNWEKKKPENV